MSEILDLPIESVYPNPDQPRKVFDLEGLRELAESIKESGLLQPLTVVPREPGAFMIVAGERRWRATKLAGLTTIQAIVKELSDHKVAELALIENLLRRDLNAMEEARAYKAFMDRGFTLRELATKLGHPTTQRVQDRLSLLNLDGGLQEGVNKGVIPYWQALEISRLNRENQFLLWRAIQDGRCETTGKLRRMAAVLLDSECQSELFPERELTAAEKKSLTKVDRFIEESGKLLNMLSSDDLEILATTPKADAAVCVEKLLLLVKRCYTVANALETNSAKQEVSKIQ